jgi:hypothetical protein
MVMLRMGTETPKVLSSIKSNSDPALENRFFQISIAGFGIK